MKKLMKRIGAVLMAVAMMAALGVSAWAAPVDGDPVEPTVEEPAAPSYDHTLKVTGLTEGDVAHFYKVIEWVGETDDDSDVAGWKAVAPFDEKLDQATLTKILVGEAAVEANPDADPPVEAKPAVPPTKITSKLAGELAALASGAGTEVPVGEDGIAELDNPAAGMWMALITPTDVDTVYNPVFVSADYNTEEGGSVAVGTGATYSDSAAAKKSTLTLIKTAANADDYNSDDADTTAVGDTVTFTVNTTIPGYGEVYTAPVFELTDKLTALELKKNEETNEFIISITAPENLQAKDDDHQTGGVGEGKYQYEITATTSGYTIKFAPEYLKTLTTATNVTVEYQAVVTTDAEDAINEEDNEVSIKYSHNPNQQDDYEVKKDTTQHYTFSLDAEGLAEGASETQHGKKTSELVKIAVDASGNPITQTEETSEIYDKEIEKWKGSLEGAVFGLWKNADCTGDAYLTATTGSDGRMNFAGLDAGNYWLKEISAPDGYVVNSDIHPVVITAELEEITVTEWWNGTEWVSTPPASGTAKEATYKTDVLKSYTVTVDGKETAKYTFTNIKETNSTDIQWDVAECEEKPFLLSNTKGTELPSTGGIGTYVFTVAGVAIMAIAAGLLVVRHKKKAE